MKELVQRNAAYKKSLEYCEETCNDVDELFVSLGVNILDIFPATEEQMLQLKRVLDSSNEHVKNVGTRKLRKAFVYYILGITEG